MSAPPPESLHNALLRVVRATGEHAEACFTPLTSSAVSLPPPARRAWTNTITDVQDTCATLQLVYPGAVLLRPSSTAALHITVVPDRPGTMFPSLCVVSLGTPSVSAPPRHANVVSMPQEVVIKEWDTSRCGGSSHQPRLTSPAASERDDDGAVHLSIPLRTVYAVISLLTPHEVDATTPLLVTLRFLGHVDAHRVHCIRRVRLEYDQAPLPKREAGSEALAQNSQAPAVSSTLAHRRGLLAGRAQSSPTPTRAAPPAPSQQSVSAESSLIEVSPPSPPMARVATESPDRDEGGHDGRDQTHVRCLERSFLGAEEAADTYSRAEASEMFAAQHPTFALTATTTQGPAKASPHISLCSSPSSWTPHRCVRSPSVVSLLTESTRPHDVVPSPPPPPSSTVRASGRFSVPSAPSEASAVAADAAPSPFCEEADVLWRVRRVLALSKPPVDSLCSRHRAPNSPAATTDTARDAPTRGPQYWASQYRRDANTSTTSALSRRSYTTRTLNTKEVAVAGHTRPESSPLRLWTWPTRAARAGRHAADITRATSSDMTNTSTRSLRPSSLLTAVRWVNDDVAAAEATVVRGGATTPRQALDTSVSSSAPAKPERVPHRLHSPSALAQTASGRPSESAAAVPAAVGSPSRAATATERTAQDQHITDVAPPQSSSLPSTELSADDASPEAPSPSPPLSVPPPPSHHALSVLPTNVPADYWLQSKPTLLGAPDSYTPARENLHSATTPSPGNARGVPPSSSGAAPPPLPLPESAESTWCVPPTVTFHARKHHATREGTGARLLTITRTQTGVDERGRATHVTDITLRKGGRGAARALVQWGARLGKGAAHTTGASSRAPAAYDGASSFSSVSTQLASTALAAPRGCSTSLPSDAAPSKVSCLTIYEDDLVQVLTGDVAYRSGYFHVDYVRSAVCCLVLLCNDQLVAAVELQSAGDVMLAKSLLTATPVPTDM